ncbi:hypothetical protein TRFO_37199 [Tritrichomonas foetus]|uniref:Protein kinase domain-containing protein n=1 Tax=Tritrichomonas foetus TaxID=1144522 RepID=A0A1J4JE97_9EUKA|nr:hypothetical protein TRFO_37199 [Tritrichomonas foetus]|eukprot:OHS96615.1 hypothetical protein TRFO_37199 [Tritrichomonas foetus]
MLSAFDLNRFHSIMTEKPFQLLPIIDLNNFQVEEELGNYYFQTTYLIKENNQVYDGQFYHHDCAESEISKYIARPIIEKCPGFIEVVGVTFSSSFKQGRNVIVTKHYENKTLRNVMDDLMKKKRTLGYDNTAKQIIITGLAKAIEILHSNRIIHNEVTPSNIWLDENFYPHLGGFEFSTPFDREAIMLEKVDNTSPVYRAPEKIESEDYDEKVDIYSFAITLYEILFDRDPYQLNSYNLIFPFLRSVQNGVRPEIPTSVSNHFLAELMEKCWDYNPRERPSASQLFKLLSEDPNYMLDGVDKHAFQSYLKTLKYDDPNSLKDEISKLKKKNQYLQNIKKENEYLITNIVEKEKEIERYKKQYDSLNLLYTKLKQKYEKLKEEEKTKKSWSSESNAKNAMIDLNEYEKKEQLSFGTFGEVYSVYHKESHEEFAAKVSKYPFSNNDADLREINILCQLKHPTIVNMKGFSFTNFEHENCITILMELIQHGSLRNLLNEEQNGNLKLDYNNTQRQIIITGIAYGMKYLHEHHIFHRDLKPDNILIDSELHPKITDFGTSKFFDPDHSHSQSQQHGTLFYMSPESLVDNHYGPESDVYSYGIMLYEILTSLPAYDMTKTEINTILKFCNKVVYQNYRPIFTIPIQKEFQELIEQCWDSEPSNRPTFSDIFTKLSSDSRYLLDDVDENEFSNYLFDLEQSQKNDNISAVRNEEVIIKLLRDNELLRQRIEELENRTKISES